MVMDVNLFIAMMQNRICLSSAEDATFLSELIIDDLLLTCSVSTVDVVPGSAFFFSSM
jgi:hypothetical protein